MPPVRMVRKELHRADFIAGRPQSGFNGCYLDFAAAKAAAPGRIGYDHLDMTGFYQPNADGSGPTMDPNDYAVMFWLRGLLPTARRVFDIGGYVGTAYYEYARYLDYPTDLRWTVYDVPAVARAGEALASDKSASHLGFTTDPTGADGADILLAAGSLQYFEEGMLHRLLGSLQFRPRHVLVQRTPLHPDRTFVTLQVMTPEGRPVYCPYTVAARGPFIAAMCKLGYELVDSWSKPRPLVVPLHHECARACYTGLYFREMSRAGATSGADLSAEAAGANVTRRLA